MSPKPCPPAILPSSPSPPPTSRLATPPNSESHRSPCREGRQCPGSPPGPSRSPHPPPLGAAAPSPASGARRARSGNRGGELPGRGPKRGSSQSGVPGGLGGGTPESLRLGAQRAQRPLPRLPPPPVAVLPTLGNRTLPPGSGFRKTPDLQILRMASRPCLPRESGPRLPEFRLRALTPTSDRWVPFLSLLLGPKKPGPHPSPFPRTQESGPQVPSAPVPWSPGPQAPLPQTQVSEAQPPPPGGPGAQPTLLVQLLFLAL